MGQIHLTLLLVFYFDHQRHWWMHCHFPIEIADPICADPTCALSGKLRHLKRLRRHNHAMATGVPVQNVAPPCRGGLPAPPHGGGQGPTSSRVPERSARPSLPPFPPLFCASASVCGCPLSPVRQYIISIIFKLGGTRGKGAVRSFWDR